jgi:hypothetical protein
VKKLIFATAGGVVCFFGFVLMARGMMALGNPNTLAITPEGAPSAPISTEMASSWFFVGVLLITIGGLLIYIACRGPGK